MIADLQRKIAERKTKFTLLKKELSRQIDEAEAWKAELTQLTTQIQSM